MGDIKERIGSMVSAQGRKQDLVEIPPSSHTKRGVYGVIGGDILGRVWQAGLRSKGCPAKKGGACGKRVAVEKKAIVVIHTCARVVFMRKPSRVPTGHTWKMESAGKMSRRQPRRNGCIFVGEVYIK